MSSKGPGAQFRRRPRRRLSGCCRGPGALAWAHFGLCWIIWSAIGYLDRMDGNYPPFFERDYTIARPLVQQQTVTSGELGLYALLYPLLIQYFLVFAANPVARFLLGRSTKSQPTPSQERRRRPRSRRRVALARPLRSPDQRSVKREAGDPEVEDDEIVKLYDFLVEEYDSEDDSELETLESDESPVYFRFDRMYSLHRLSPLFVMLEGIGLATLMTSFLKLYVGRWRPNALALCNYKDFRTAADSGDFSAYWAATTSFGMGDPSTCTGTWDEIINSHQSFPSGHSSFSFAGLTATAVFMYYGISYPPKSALRVFGLLAAIVPLLLACWISGSRAVDHYHHWGDVAFGSVLGLVAALFAVHLHLPDTTGIIGKSRRRYQRRQSLAGADPTLLPLEFREPSVHMEKEEKRGDGEARSELRARRTPQSSRHKGDR